MTENPENPKESKKRKPKAVTTGITVLKPDNMTIPPDRPTLEEALESFREAIRDPASADLHLTHQLDDGSIEYILFSEQAIMAEFGVTLDEFVAHMEESIRIWYEQGNSPLIHEFIHESQLPPRYTEL